MSLNSSLSKTVLLTGGTGSFGCGFAQFLSRQPDIGMIRIFSRDEHKQYSMRKSVTSYKISYYIGDIRDKDRLARVMDGCHWVIHAAALKQAPVGEIEPQEFIKTNVIGSMNVVEAALDCGVERALLISTDKAVEPVNLYGATKMCAERMFLRADRMRAPKRTRFACTRYGNVAKTAGSIVPVLLSLGPNEPSMIYDMEATRFWLTLDEANEFIWSSISENFKPGEVMIPRCRMVRVMDIIKALRPGKQINVMKPRPGDKRHEVLHVDGDFRISSNDGPFMSQEEITKDVFGTLLA